MVVLAGNMLGLLLFISTGINSAYNLKSFKTKEALKL